MLIRSTDCVKLIAPCRGREAVRLLCFRLMTMTALSYYHELSFYSYVVTGILERFFSYVRSDIVGSVFDGKA